MPKKQTKRFYITDRGDVESLWNWFDDMRELFAGGPVVISLERPTRSLDQNAYYFGVVIETIRQGLLDAGQPLSGEAIHEHFATKYLPVESKEWVDLDTGEKKQRAARKSTSDLDSTAFHEYIERIKHDELVRQLDIYIPDPNQPPPEAYDAKS